MGYAKDVVRDVLRYRFQKMEFGTGDMLFAEDIDETHEVPAGQQDLLKWMSEGSPKRILDLAC